MDKTSYNDYLADKLDSSINYTEYLSVTFKCDTWIDLDESKNVEKMKQREAKIDKLLKIK